MNKQKEIKAEEALYCPSSGIIDAAALIQSLDAELQELGVIVSFNSEVTDIQVIGSNEFRLKKLLLVRFFTIDCEKPN
ncbi:MAG: hypothetical protein Ct9H300mP20_02600 [Gammaproteobacteria bacterium]|nr:MAG: hypothetical protein Ct9H300mP20_02600 [Gammaproteobacteria bacterium]